MPKIFGPCPHCGRKGNLQVSYGLNEIRCTFCGAFVPKVRDRTPEDASNLWKQPYGYSLPDCRTCGQVEAHAYGAFKHYHTECPCYWDRTRALKVRVKCKLWRNCDD